VLVAATPPRRFALASAGQFLFGITLALPGTLFGLPAWTGGIGLDLEAQANLLVVFYAGQFFWTALAGALVDRIGSERVLAIGSAVITSGFVLLARATGPSEASAAAGLLASGGAAINAASNAMVASSYGERASAMLSRMAMFGAGGALVAPAILAGSHDVAAVALRAEVLAAAAFVIALIPLTVTPAPLSAATSLVRALVLLRERHVMGLIVLLWLEFGTEAILAGWSAAFALAVLPGAPAGLVVALFWGGLAVGRLGGPGVLARLSRLQTVITGGVLATASIVVMALAPGFVIFAAAVFVGGLAVGPLAPTIIGVGGHRYPAQMGTVIGLLISAGQIGSMVFPWLTGQVAAARGFRVAMFVPAAAAVGLVIGSSIVQARRR
jgi:fucose permease